MEKQPDYKNVTDHTGEIILYTDSDYKIYKDVHDLEKASDLIVEVSSTSDINHINQTIEDEIPQFYWTETKVKVNKTYKGSSANEIIIYEPYTAFYGQQGTKKMFIETDYKPIIPNTRYLMFLKKHEDGGYMPLGIHQGKINLDNHADIYQNLANSARIQYGYQ